MAQYAVPGEKHDAAGNNAITLAECRPGSLAEIALWAATPKTAKAITAATGVDRLPEIGRAVAAPDLLLVSVGPGRYLAIGQQQGLSDRLSASVPAEAGAVVDLTHGRVGLRISGSPATALLQKGVSFDVDPSVFGPMSAASSAIHHMGVTIIRLDTDSFDVFAMASFAGSLWDWVTDAAVEYGWQVSVPVE